MAAIPQTSPVNLATPVFWYEELASPLFWLTHPQNRVFRNNLVVLYTKRRQRTYYLNGREKQERVKGRQYFASITAIDRYLDTCLKLITRLEAFNNAPSSSEDIFSACENALRLLNSYVDLYTKTESDRLENLESELRPQLARLGQIRLRVREAVGYWYATTFAALIRQLARETSVSVSDLYVYTYSDLESLMKLNKQVEVSTAKQRKRGYAAIINRNHHEIIVGHQFQEIQNQLHQIDERTAGPELLLGTTAQVGVVQGRVRVILHNQIDISKEVKAFKAGEILVTEMTRPDVVLACRKAAAIITDEGGLASHAAIIARELQIPCIVGTKVATRLLHDGDLVGVTAKESVGVIKKLMY